MSLTDLFSKMEDKCIPVGPVTFDWAAKDIGWGQMSFYLNKEDGYVHCGNEIMSRQFLKDMLCQMVDNCVLDEPNERHSDTGPNGEPPGYSPRPIEFKDDFST